MKTRNGFVSNSSSSSFLVASKEDADEIEISLTLKVRMRDLTEWTLENKKDLFEYFKDNWGLNTEHEILKEEYTARDYKACVKALNEGKKIHVVTVSSDGTPLEAAIYDSGEGKLPTSPDYEVISK